MPISLAARGPLLRLSVSICLSAAFVASGHAQATAVAELDELGGITAAATNNDSGPSGIIPAERGFNASLGTTSQHDSSSGWSSLLTPNIAYRFNRYFSADAEAPLYVYINIDTNVGTTAKPVYAYKPKNGVFGDTTLAAHFDATAPVFDYNATVSMGLPSGNTAFGLGAGQVTYDINNHFEKALWIFTPDIELGEGDTSALVNQRVLKSYVAVGPLAHFQAGTAVDLSHNISFEANAYEELPLAKDLVYSTTGKGKKKVTTSTNTDPAEDNGFVTSLDIPLAAHVTLSGFYDRSLRDHDDTAGLSLTLFVKAQPSVTTAVH